MELRLSTYRKFSKYYVRFIVSVDSKDNTGSFVLRNQLTEEKICVRFVFMSTVQRFVHSLLTQGLSFDNVKIIYFLLRYHFLV